MRNKRFIFFCVFPFALQGCGRNNVINQANIISPSAPKKPVSTSPIKDSWYSPAPDNAVPAEWNQVDGQKISEVAGSMLPAAEQLLATQQIIPITVEKAKSFSNRPILPMGNETPYLVRAVYFNKGTGTFEAYQRNQELWILHSSLGRSTPTMKRQTLVILLSSNPNKIYVDCSLAE